MRVQRHLREHGQNAPDQKDQTIHRLLEILSIDAIERPEHWLEALDVVSRFPHEEHRLSK